MEYEGVFIDIFWQTQQRVFNSAVHTYIPLRILVCIIENTPKYSKLCTYRYGGVLSILLVILLGLVSQIEIFGKAPPNIKSELKIFWISAFAAGENNLFLFGSGKF
jgi:hypothetical protein